MNKPILTRKHCARLLPRFWPTKRASVQRIKNPLFASRMAKRGTTETKPNPRRPVKTDIEKALRA